MIGTTNLPPLIDCHFHLDPKKEGAFETETRAALMSGFGTVLVMPNTNPPWLTRDSLVELWGRAPGQLHCNVGLHFGTDGRNQLEFSWSQGLVRGLKLYLGPTTGNLQVQDPRRIDVVFSTWPNGPTGKPILVHVDDINLLRKVVALAFRHNQRLHICHVARAEEVSIIRKAKQRSDGKRITAEVCPHHCLFTEDDLPKLDRYGFISPPLGEKRDLDALWRGIRDGTIDIIATDHAPHSEEEKSSANPPVGVIGEGAFSVMWMAFRQRGLPIEKLVEMMHVRPAEIFGIRPDGQSYMDVDLSDRFTFEREMIQSSAGRSPYEGMDVLGRIRSVVLHGVEVVRDGKILPGPRRGVVI